LTDPSRIVWRRSTTSVSVIERVLVYGLLTASLALVYFVYFGGVVALQYVFHALIGESSQLAVVGTTLAIAAQFGPLRTRIQVIGRRFYRRRYAAARVPATFGARLREEVGLGAPSDDLLKAVRETVQETVQPAHLSLWLRPSDEVPLAVKGEDL
jgi:hypothetical protein